MSPIPFDQYGSKLDADLLGSQTILEPKALSMTIILDEDSPPSDHDVDPSMLKRLKLFEADRADIGWESPENWEYDNETLASKIAKLKKKQDGEVHNSPKNASQMDLAKEVAAVSGVPKARRSEAIPSPSQSPAAAARRSARTKEGAAESMLQKATKRAAAKAGTQSPHLASMISLLFQPRQILFSWVLLRTPALLNVLCLPERPLLFP
jgi:hypothetical protein